MILGSGPNRIGQGIEFDYCCVHAAMTRARAGPRRGDGQLQPRDGLDRLRHLGPALLRAADGRGRARGRRGRAARGGRRPVRRPDAAADRAQPGARRACSCSAPPSTRSTSRRTAGASARCSRSSASSTRPTGVAHSPEESRRARRAQVGFPLLVRPSYVLGGRAMEICYSEADLEAYLERARGRRQGRGPRGDVSAAARPLPRERDRDRRRRARRRRAVPTSRGSCSTSRRPASTPATRPACCRRCRSAARCWSRSAARRSELALRLGVIGLLNVQFALVDNDQPLRDRGQPARLAHRAVRLEGDRRPAREGRLPADPGRAARGPGAAARARGPRSRQRQGGGAAVPALPRLGRAARPGDEVDRRGDGHRGATSRPPSARRRPPRASRCRSREASSSASATPTSRRRRSSPPACTTSASGCSPRAAPRRRSAAWACRSSS